MRIATAFLLLIALSVTSLAQTGPALRGGVVLNEVLPDPNSTTNNFDTDGNGTAGTPDEFVELYNVTSSAIDISGLELWDDGTNLWFTFPAGSAIPAGGFAVVIAGVQSGGALPGCGYDAGEASGVLNNTGDNVVLYDPTADEYIQFTYNGDAQDDPPVDYAGDGFSTTASLVTPIEAWGNDTDGVSLVRNPDGSTTIVKQNTVGGVSANATPCRFNSTGLPVELASFSGMADGNTVHLSWSTDSESANAGFAVEQAVNGGPLTEIGFVDGAGFSVEPRSYAFSIDHLKQGTYTYRLKQIDFDGAYTGSPEIEVIVGMPDNYLIEPAYPNPFNPSTTIRFGVSAEQQVSITLHDALGREVRHVSTREVQAGRMYDVRVHGTGLPTGIYLVRLQGETFTSSQRVTLVK